MISFISLLIEYQFNYESKKLRCSAGLAQWFEEPTHVLNPDFFTVGLGCIFTVYLPPGTIKLGICRALLFSYVFLYLLYLASVARSRANIAWWKLTAQVKSLNDFHTCCPSSCSSYTCSSLGLNKVQ